MKSCACVKFIINALYGSGCKADYSVIKEGWMR